MNDGYVEYFRSIARGGVAACVTGIQVIDPDWHYISSRQTWICDDRFIPGLKRVCEAVHEEGALIFFQPWHSGQAGLPTGIEGTEPVTLNDFSLEEIHEIQEKWFQAARRAKEAGADGIEFHCAHTYLPSQFLSPEWNHRHDEYGIDTIENAARFSIEIVRRIVRELCDDTFMVILKINGDDFLENGGGTHIDRCVEACRLFEAAGVRMITVNGGGAISRVECMSDNGAQPEGWKVYLAEAVKQAVKIPVAASGSLRHPDYVSAIIREGRCDLAAIGRGIFAEREWVKKCEEGREDEMRYCISCMHCFSIDTDGISGCSVNPFAKREGEIPQWNPQEGTGRKAMVVGAGPSGLEAAVTLAQRGFEVTLADSHEEIGGMVRYAMLPPDKQKLGWMLEYYRKQISRLGITQRLKENVTEEWIDRQIPDVVIIASGSRENIPPIPGVNLPGVLSVRQAFEAFREEKEPFSGKTVILGAGLTGLELGRLISSRGSTVNVLEALPAPASPSMEMKLALKAARKEGMSMHYQMKIREIQRKEEGGFQVIAQTAEGDETRLEADVVIRCMGIRSESELADSLKEKDKPYQVFRVGDCIATGNICSAVQSGADTAYMIR